MSNKLSHNTELPKAIQEIIVTTLGHYPEKISIIHGGLSGANLYQMQLFDTIVVLRMADPDIGGESDLNAMILAAESNIAPRIYYVDVKLGVIIMEHVANQPYSFQDPKLMNAFAAFLQKLHGIKVENSSIAKLPLAGYLAYPDTIVKQVQNKEIVPEYIVLLQNKLKDLLPCLAPEWGFSLCHNDINPQNLLFNGQEFRLVDWDSARITDPYIDLAAVMNFFLFDPKLADNFFAMYLGRAPSDKECKKLFYMRQISLYFYGMQFLKLATESNEVSLINVDVSDLTSPPGFFMRLGSGQEDLSKPMSQARLGLILLKTAVSNL